MDAKQLRHFIVKPTLLELGMHSLAAENLVMGTAAQESRLLYIHQLGSGPALSLFQMEPNTYDDIWTNYLEYKEDLAETILNAVEVDQIPKAERMLWDLKLSAIMCRVHYRRVPKVLPAADNIPALAQYWKTHYNTELGAGTVEEFIRNYDLVK